jgi:hypothetical protein
MEAIRIEAVIQNDGELHLSHLPYRKGDRVEAIVFALDSAEAARKREEAIQEFLALARASTFRSTGPYPSRDELYDRS